MRSIALSALVLAFTSVSTANTCVENERLRNAAISLAKSEAKQESLLIGGQPTEFEVVKFETLDPVLGQRDPEAFDTFAARV